MRHSDSRAALTGEVARFQAEIRRLALAAAREIVQQELDRRLARLAAGARRRTVLAPEPTKPRELPAPEPVAATEAGPREPAPAPPSADGRKRVAWTREAIIQELASWMASGTAIDAAFVARHGPRGLVAATRRIFGRFDAALNVAGLHFAKLYPDGPPSR
ncbi:MAG TPA: hypothetical protein VK607_04055 [Kofleriaceae bacterium]|nr:hypothetical protein [Kofleriaceae bacterium]